MNSIDVTRDNFQVEVIDRSKLVPVVVDFWAEWCQPCQMLKPVLEALTTEYKGKFILAKVNVDNNQELASQFGVRGIPSVKAISGGRIVNEFSGVLPEAEIRKFLSQIVPSESEEHRLHARAILETGDIDAALNMLEKALELDEDNFKAAVDKAEICLMQRNFDTAEEILKKLPLAFQTSDPQVNEMLTRIDIARRRAALPDKLTLLAQINENPAHLKLKLDLANVYIAEQNYSAALDLLFDIIQQDKHFGDDVARTTILDVFNLLGSQDNLVRESRKKLSRLLN